MRLIRYIFVVVLLCSSGQASAAVEGDCLVFPVDDVFGLHRDYDLVCYALGKTQAFFYKHGIDIKRPITVGLHDVEMPNHVGYFGLFDAHAHRVDILSYDGLRHLMGKRQPFGMPMSEEMYISFSVHEFAHAVAEQNFSYHHDSLLVHEYLAYVTQLATMDEALRASILQRYDVPGFSDIGEMSPIYYQLDPNAFGVKAYKHYIGLENPVEFLRKLLSGEIRPSGASVEWW